MLRRQYIAESPSFKGATLVESYSSTSRCNTPYTVITTIVVILDGDPHTDWVFALRTLSFTIWGQLLARAGARKLCFSHPPGCIPRTSSPNHQSCKVSGHGCRQTVRCKMRHRYTRVTAPLRLLPLRNPVEVYLGSTKFSRSFISFLRREARSLAVILVQICLWVLVVTPCCE